MRIRLASLLHHSLFVLVSLLLGTTLCASDNEVFINDVSEATTFYNNVNNKITSYEGTTVYLTNDFDLSSYKVSTPIGTANGGYFKGTFDGQGHILKGLTMSSSELSYLGLFGYSTGMTVRNVVIDLDSSITNSIQATNTYTGGILGSYTTNSGPIIIENVVNMGSVSCTGSSISSYKTHLGGIIGYIMNTNDKKILIRNCVNYGTVTYGGSYTGYVGGIAGYSRGTTTNYVHIQNCFNYGHLSGTTYIGGIIGFGASYTITENCVSVGAISSSKGYYIGSIVGAASSSISITHCFWTSDTGCSNACSDSTIQISNSSLITPSTETVGKLNDYAESNSEANDITWNKWLLNEKSKSVTFFINSIANSITLSSKIILLPNITLTGYSFNWYTDSVKSTKFSSVSITDDISLYGGVQPNSYTVTFDGNEGTVSGESTRTVTYGQQYGVLPEATRDGYALSGWSTEADEGTVVESTTTVTIANDHTLYAQWTKNNYIVTFDFGNGTMINESFTYNSKIHYPEEITIREGYIFNGWNPKPDLMPAYNFTATTQWVKNIYTVTFDFGNKTMINESFPYNSEIQYPEDNSVVREGYTFNGWNPKPDLMPSYNFTTTANWTEIPKEIPKEEESSSSVAPTLIKITFGSINFNEEEIISIVSNYTDAEFTIVKFETDSKSGELTVIIKFTDKEKAESFVEVIKNSSTNDVIKNAMFITDNIKSFSHVFTPLLFFIISLII